MRPRPKLRLPERCAFGRYLVDAGQPVLGKGNFSQVVPGHEQGGTMAVAIKIEQLRGAGSRSRLPAEAECYRSLEGAHEFPRMHWFGHRHGLTALVLDRLGPSVKSLLVDSPSGMACTAEWRRVGLGALRALEALHERRWLHCDVKPGNFLLGADSGGGECDDADPAVRLVDFGLARQVGLDERRFCWQDWGLFNS